MTESILGIIPPPSHQPDLAVQIPADVVLAPEHFTAPVDPAQARAVDLIFTHRSDETAAAALTALWASTMLLADLSQEHLNRIRREELDCERDPRDPEPES
jgi:hypothetical protein